MNNQSSIHRIWALADLHLSIGLPSKDMKIFGSQWEGYMDKIARSWKDKIDANDLVLLPGDICWAMKAPEAQLNLNWIDQLPGTKVMIRGNHDYWWGSGKKMAELLPPSIHFIHNTAFHWNEVGIGGTRLWDTLEYQFDEYIDYIDLSNIKEGGSNQNKEQKKELSPHIFERELERLRLSLKQINPSAKLKIAMVHYPPISADLKPSLTSQILEEFKIDICIFGHLHNVKKDRSLFGKARGVQYYLTSCDYLDFSPLKIMG